MSRANPLSFAPARASFETNSQILTNSYNRGSDAAHGPVTSTAGDSTDSTMWAKFFGLPRKEVEKDPYLFNPRENYDLPEAYHGANLYLDLLIIYQIRLSQMQAITQMLPLRRWDKSISISWDIWNFNAGHLGRTPEESMSRLLTSSFDTGSATFHRWGLAFMLEHGFMNTARGRMNYRYNLVQIANATIETLCFGVIVALLSCAPMSFLSTQSMTSVSTDAQRWAMFQEEIDQWACVHKRESPLMWLWDKLRQKVQSRTGDAADIFFLPYGTQGKLMRPEETMYFLSGKPHDYNRGTQMPGVQIIESRDYKVGEGRDEDPAWQERTIGQHSWMLMEHLGGVKPCDYRTDMMDIALFCEKDDAFKRVQYKRAVFATGMFNHNLQNDTWELAELGLAFLAEMTTWGDYLTTVGMLDPWANQLVNCGNNARLLDFIHRFGGVDRVPGGDDDADAAVAGKFTARRRPKTGGAFRESDQDRDDHGSAGALGLHDEADDLALTDDGVAIMKYLYERYSGVAPVDVEEENEGDEGDAPPSPKGSGEEKSDEDTPKATYRKMVASALAQVNQVSDNAWAYAWAAYQLGRWIRSPDDAVRRDNNLRGVHIICTKMLAAAADLKAITTGVGGWIQGIFTLTRDLESVAPGTKASYALNAIQRTTSTNPGIRPTDLFALDEALVYGCPYTVVAQSTDGDRAELFMLHNLFNATVDFAQAMSKPEKAKANARLDAAVRDAMTKWAGVQGAANTIANRENKLQLAYENFAEFIAREGGGVPNHKVFLASCKTFTDRKSATSPFQRQLAALRTQRAAINPTGAAQGRFHADQKADEQAHPDEIAANERDVGKHKSVYARTPAIRTILGDKNMFLIYHRMVLAKERDDNQIISRSQFIYLMSLIEAMYETDLDAAKGANVKDKQRAERNAELRVIYFIQECAFQRMFRLKDFLKITPATADLWDSGLAVDTFLQRVAGTDLQARIRKTQNALLDGLKTFSEDFMTEWHKKLPAGVRKELARLGGVQRVVKGGSSVPELAEAVVAIKKVGHQKTAEQDIMMAGLGGGGGGGGGNSSLPLVTADYIKELLRNMPIVDGELIRWGLDNNMLPLVGIFLLKPYGTWIMGQAFAMQGGGKVGYTFEGHHDFQLQDNAVRKMHMGHWTLYAKPIVIRPEGVAHGFNIVAKEYLGGNNDEYWDINNPNHVADYNEGKFFSADIFAVAVRINRSRPNWVYDITGRFNRYLGNTPEYCKERSLELWASSWGWVQDSGNPLERPIIPHDETQQFNTLVFQVPSSARTLLICFYHRPIDSFTTHTRANWSISSEDEATGASASTMDVVKSDVVLPVICVRAATPRPLWLSLSSGGERIVCWCLSSKTLSRRANPKCRHRHRVHKWVGPIHSSGHTNAFLGTSRT